MKKYLFLYFLSISILSISSNRNLSTNTEKYILSNVLLDDTTIKNDPTRRSVTGNVTDITTKGATISAWANGMSEVSASDLLIGILYSKDPTIDKYNWHSSTISVDKLDKDGKYSIKLSLSSYMTYYYQSFVRMGGLYFYGDILSFKTADEGISVDNLGTSTITCFSAKINSKIILTNKLTLSNLTYGVCYASHNNPTTNDKYITASKLNSDSTYNTIIGGLAEDSTYYYRPFVHYYSNGSSGGEHYGAVKSFKTNKCNITRTGDIDIETMKVRSTFNLEGGAFSKISFGVCYSKNDVTPTIYNTNFTTSDIGEDNSFTIKIYPSKGKIYYRSFVLIDGVPHYGEVKSFINESCDTKEYVDLGLPSGIQWATCNVGATHPWNYGDYFAWGETEGRNSGKQDFSLETYKFYDSTTKGYTKYCIDEAKWGGEGKYDYLTTLDPEDDAATVNWGNDWRMPTIDEIDELLSNCYFCWTNSYKGSGVKGYICYKRLEKDNVVLDIEHALSSNCKASYDLSCNHIFFPQTGTYYNTTYNMGSNEYLVSKMWSSSLNSGNTHWADYLSLTNCVDKYHGSRFVGQSIRPVYNKKNEQCEVPTIKYDNGKLYFECGTADAQIIGKISCNDVKEFANVSSLSLNENYIITAYATKAGYSKSETAEVVLAWLKDESNIETVINKIEVQTIPILISLENGTITIRGVKNGTEVAIYSSSGYLISSGISKDGTVSLDVHSQKYKTVIIKAGSKSTKYYIK